MFSQFKPAVPRTLLYFIAGVLWTAVGIMLCLLAFTWIAPLDIRWEISDIVIGSICAFLAYRFGFSALAKKNIRRIAQFSETVCVFAFQAWKSYGIIAVMVFLGITLRHSSFPKKYLAIVYFTIGEALFLASIHYYGRLRKLSLEHKKPLF
jgi:hypothetical protein